MIQAKTFSNRITSKKKFICYRKRVLIFCCRTLSGFLTHTYGFVKTEKIKILYKFSVEIALSF